MIRIRNDVLTKVSFSVFPGANILAVFAVQVVFELIL